MTPEPNRRGRLVAIVTGAVSILVGVLYLAMIVVLDSRGALLPPPPEALGQGESLTPGAVAAAAGPAAAEAPPPA